MRLDHLPGDVHLTYCTNIHAGESWDEVRDSLEAHLPRIKAQVSPDAPLGLGLRLSAIAAQALSEPAALDELRSLLSRHDLYVFTINAFPYGPFHGTRVKEDVYQPDWLTPERLTYTDQRAEILAALLPEGLPGSVSTVPGTFKPVAASRPDAPRAMADMMARHAATLVEMQRRTGREIVLALEPEPCCFLETIEETLAFFRDHLHTDASAAIVAEATGLSREQAREALRRHLGVCYDICHGAVEFEDPADAFARFSAAGIRIAKLQLSSALRLPASAPTPSKRSRHSTTASTCTRSWSAGTARSRATSISRRPSRRCARARRAANGACIATFRCSSKSPGSFTRRSRR